MLIATEDWSSFLDKRLPCDVVYFDFAKAFDSVSHNILLSKLHSIGIPPFLYSILHSYLKSRKQRVRVRTSFSNWSPVPSGVPQGSVLGPLLFLLFINDLPNLLTSMCLLFADDLKIYRSISSTHDAFLLQSDIDTIHKWCQDNCLPLNISKCKVLHLGPKNAQHPYYFSDSVLTPVNQVNDLGVIVDSHLKFHYQALAASAKARRIGNYLLKFLTYVDPGVLRIIITSSVRPQLEYCIQAWRPFYSKSAQVLERTFRYFTKRCQSLYHLPYETRLQILSLPSLSVRFNRGDLLQTYKLIHGHDATTYEKFFTLSNYSRTRGHQLKIQPMPFRTNYRKATFSQRVVDPWNKLPQSVVTAPSVATWKARFDKLYS